MLYAAETYTCRLMAFRITAPGKVDLTAGLGGPGIPLYRPAGYKFFDSLGVEESGNICVATIGECGISVISPTGALVDFVPTDDVFTTNICWGGADQKTAYVTLSGTGRLAAIGWPRPGLALAHG
jgi:gluconolactonase